MADKKKPNRALLLFFGAFGCLALCLVIAIVSGTFLWTLSKQTESQTEGPVPQPSVAITAQTIDQVRELYRIPQPGYVYDVAWSPDGKILAAAMFGSGSDPGSVHLWDAETGENLLSFEQIRVTRLAFSPDVKMLVAIGDQGVIAWSMVDGSKLVNMEIDFPGARSLAFSTDGRILALSKKNTVTLLEMPSGRTLNSLQHPNEVWGFAFLPDGKSLMTAATSEKIGADAPGMVYETTFTIWNIESGQAARTFTQPFGLNQLVVSPDGKSFATGQTGADLHVWDMASGQQLRVFTGFQFGVPRFSFSPDGSVLAAGEGIGFEVASPSGLRLFNVATGREVPMLKGHTGVIFNVAFSPDGRLLATASEDKTVRLWGVPPDK